MMCMKGLAARLVQVTTIRSTARKPDIPHDYQPVSKLQAIGRETVSKLKDLSTAALASSHAEDFEILQDFTKHTPNVITGECCLTVHTRNLVVQLRILAVYLPCCSRNTVLVICD